MAKKLEAEKELSAKQAELQGEETTTVKEKETIESEADSVSIEEIKSKTLITPGNFPSFSRNSNIAPPPVEINILSFLTSRLFIAATVSPPPIKR
jgi:hypothetical protein